MTRKRTRAFKIIYGGLARTFPPDATAEEVERWKEPIRDHVHSCGLSARQAAVFRRWFSRWLQSPAYRRLMREQQALIAAAREEARPCS